MPPIQTYYNVIRPQQPQNWNQPKKRSFWQRMKNRFSRKKQQPVAPQRIQPQQPLIVNMYGRKTRKAKKHSKK